MNFQDDLGEKGASQYCDWMEEEEKTGKITPGDKVIWDAEVEFMSPVSTPAVTDSEFLMIKEKARDPSKIMIKWNIPLLNKKSSFDEDERMIYAPALLPDKADGNREAIPKAEIKKAAIKYMEMYRKVDNEHSFMDGDGVPIFSWILQEDQKFMTMAGKEKIYPEGTWMMGIKVLSDKVWEMVKSGERNGFSIAGSWKVLEIKSKARGPGGHTADGTGPHGAGDGPGKGEGDGSGLSGGESAGMTVEDIAKKHGVEVSVIEAELKLGIRTEMEHTNDPTIAMEIAMDHLAEMPDYYSKLSIMEESKSSSEEEQSLNEVTNMEIDEAEFMKLFEKAYTTARKKEAEEQSQKEALDEKNLLTAELEKVKKELEALKASKAEEQKDEKADDDDEEEEEEKAEFEDEDEEEEDDEKKVEQKASKSYDSKMSKKATKPPEKKAKQSKGILNAKITVKKEPLGDINHA